MSDLVGRLRSYAKDQGGWHCIDDTCEEAADRIEQLEAALRPFGEYLDQAAFDKDNNGHPMPDEQGVGWVYLTVGDFRRARAALNQSQPTQRRAECGSNE